MCHIRFESDVLRHRLVRTITSIIIIFSGELLRVDTYGVNFPSIIAFYLYAVCCIIIIIIIIQFISRSMCRSCDATIAFGNRMFSCNLLIVSIFRSVNLFERIISEFSLRLLISGLKSGQFFTCYVDGRPVKMHRSFIEMVYLLTQFHALRSLFDARISADDLVAIKRTLITLCSRTIEKQRNVRCVPTPSVCINAH